MKTVCQDVSLLLEPLDLASQPRELFPLNRAQHILAGATACQRRQPLATQAEMLYEVAPNSRESSRRAASLYELDHPAAKLHWIRGSGSGHFGLLPATGSGVREIGATPHSPQLVG